MTEQVRLSEIHDMMETTEWEQRTLSNIVRVNDYPKLKKGDVHRYVGMRDLDTFERKIKGSEQKEYTYTTPRFQNEDTLFPKMSRCLHNGKTAYVNILDEDEVAFGSTEFVVLSATESILPKYIYYTVRRPDIRKQALKWRNGTTARRQRISTEVFDHVQIRLPPISEQKQIVAVLDSLDTKIESNGSISDLLESTAQEIFKYRFVDFEPYEEFKHTDLGQIPECFEVTALSEVASVEKGLSYSSNHWDPDGYALVNLKNINEGGGFNKDGIKYYSGPHKEKHVINKGDVVIALTEQSMNGELIGSPAIIPPLENSKKMVISTDLAAIRSKSEDVSNYFLYNLMKHSRFRDYSERMSTGTTVYHYKSDNVEDFELALPPKNEIEQFNQLVEPFYKRIFTGSLQNTYLKQLREILLPRLLKGQIRVNELSTNLFDNLGG